MQALARCRIRAVAALPLCLFTLAACGTSQGDDATSSPGGPTSVVNVTPAPAPGPLWTAIPIGLADAGDGTLRVGPTCHEDARAVVVEGGRSPRIRLEVLGPSIGECIVCPSVLVEGIPASVVDDVTGEVVLVAGGCSTPLDS